MNEIARSETIRANAVNAFASLRFHWPEYLMEAGELALYMFVTCALATLLQHPASPVGHLIANAFFRRALMGFGMGATVVAIITSPWGKQSGAHFNPGVTLTFYRLGKIDFFRCSVLRNRTILRRSERCRNRYSRAARRAGSGRGALRGDDAWRVWQRYRLCRGNDDFFYSYEHGLVRVQSRKHRTIHTVLCRRTCCNILDL